MKKISQRFAVILLMIIGVSFLTGCRNYAELKQMIQQAYDNNNPRGNRAFCLLVGYNNEYPYITKYIIEDRENVKFLWNERLNKKLKLFTRLNLFSQSLVASGDEMPDGEPLYRYDLTEEGKKYVRLSADSTSFCFGRRVIQDITGDGDDKDNWGSTVTTILFTYTIDNVPEWVKDPEVIKVYGTMAGGHTRVDGRVSDDLLFFREVSGKLIINDNTSMRLYR